MNISNLSNYFKSVSPFFYKANLIFSWKRFNSNFSILFRAFTNIPQPLFFFPTVDEENLVQAENTLQNRVLNWSPKFKVYQAVPNNA